MSEISVPIPFHITKSQGARAYAAQALTPGRRSVVPPANQVESTAFRQAAPRLPSATIARLVAARVPGGIDFSAASPSPTASAAAIPFYRHPADNNAAATALTAGKVLDTTA